MEGYTACTSENSSIIFCGNQEEILRIENNGDIFVRGALVENDAQVVSGLRNFLSEQGAL
ncbi:hypothetical protein KQJ23_00235 [Paenibacillus sp. MSJ-6]|uniref:Uncharacterized protein n=2 Tax=Paenibacillus brevis TaxID=2841508 RepID=A0ABS6FM46_9BACL|nr:hypothetical protein [Paenibacillus brevis]MBU5670245.1 hypothetical protein [Paenibacillus brevis]